MAEIRELALAGVFEITVPRIYDDRGFFSETWSQTRLLGAGIDSDFVQDNHSYSKTSGVLRGLHFQKEPFAQDKLVRVVRGAIFDVAVDIRPDSPRFGDWIGLEISEESWNQIFIPKGFAHGFLTLEDNTEVAYKVSSPYSREHEGCIRFDDPDLAIRWPRPVDGLSVKDQSAPFLADI